MAQLTLISDHERQIKPLVAAALNNELRLLQAGISRTEQNLRRFEKRFALSTSEFIRRYENDQMQESPDYAEWIGEYRMMEHLREKAEALRGIRFAN